MVECYKTKCMTCGSNHLTNMSGVIKSDIIKMPAGSCTTPNCMETNFEVLYHVDQSNKIYDVQCLICGDKSGRFTAKEGVVYNIDDMISIPHAECRYCKHNLFRVVRQVE